MPAFCAASFLTSTDLVYTTPHPHPPLSRSLAGTKNLGWLASRTFASRLFIPEDSVVLGHDGIDRLHMNSSVDRSLANDVQATVSSVIPVGNFNL